MLNNENKYKAFHISFYPNISLTAGLNIFEKTFHSRRKGDAYTHLHMQMNKSTGYKPEVQTTIPSKSICKKEKKKKKKCTYSKLSVNLCTVLSLSRQLLKLDIDHSFKNGISKHSTIECHLSGHKQEDHMISFICYRWVTFGVNNKGHITFFFLTFFFFQLRKQW